MGLLRKSLPLLPLLLSCLIGCVPSNIPADARQIQIPSGTVYVFTANGSSILPDVRIYGPAQRLMGSGIDKMLAEDLRDATYTCPDTEFFGWFEPSSLNEVDGARADIKQQLRDHGYSSYDRVILDKSVGKYNYQYSVVTKNLQTYVLTWIWFRQSDMDMLFLDICRAQPKDNSAPLVYHVNLPARE